MNTWYVAILIKVQIDEVFTFISDIILFHGEIHVQRSIDSLPGVGGSMVVQFKVSIKDFVHGFFLANFDNVISFS